MNKYIDANKNRRLGVVSSSLDQPLNRKSISIALAFALRACVRESGAAWARDASGVAGRGRVQFVWVVRPAGRHF